MAILGDLFSSFLMIEYELLSKTLRCLARMGVAGASSLMMELMIGFAAGFVPDAIRF